MKFFSASIGFFLTLKQVRKTPWNCYFYRLFALFCLQLKGNVINISIILISSNTTQNDICNEFIINIIT